MKRIFALLTIALATLLGATAPASAQNGATPNPYGLTGAFTNITTTGFMVQLTANPGFPAGQSFEISFDLTGVPQCGNPFVDIPGNTGVLTGTGGPFIETIPVTFPTPLTGGYVFYGNILLGTKGTVVQVPFPTLNASGQINAPNVPSTCTPVKPPMLTCGAHSSGTVGVPFNSGPVSVTGGTAPYTFSIASGSLPSGLSLNTTTGVVSGTPLAAGTFSIEVTDSKGLVSTTTCPITIVPPPPMLIVTCGSSNVGTVGTPFNSGPLSVTGGTQPYTFSIGSGTLPAGLTLNPATGAVTGTPTAAGTFTIKVTDHNGLVATTTCSITILPQCVLSQLGVAGSYSILGLQNSTINLSSGPLQVNGNTGIGQNGNIHLSGGATLQGTLFADPTAHVQIDGGSSFAGGVVTQSMTGAQNAALAEAATISSLTPTQTFGNINNALTIFGNGGQNVIQVNGQIQMSGAPLTISGGSNDRFYITVTNGFALSGGSNIVLNGVSPNQVLFYFPGVGENVQTSGKANTEGIFLAPQGNIQINGGVHTSEFIAGGTLSFQSNPVVNMIPSCTPQNLALSCPVSTGTVGTPYSSSLLATGGITPYMFSLQAGSLPLGLMLNFNTGAITGTPTAANTYGFTAEVMDSSGQAAGTVTKNCNITTTTNNMVCTISASQTNLGQVSWNKFNPTGSNDVVWINMHIGTPSGVSTSSITTVQFTGAVFALNGTNYALPNGVLVFDPSAPATPSTTFNAGAGANGTWTTTLNPSHLSDEIFFDGSAIPVDSNISGGGQGTITYTTTSSDNNLAFNWQWSAAAYTFWPGANAFDNSANILAYHQSLHAGTPQNTQVQQSLEQGPRGGGGSNFTGSWSGTGNGSCPGAH